MTIFNGAGSNLPGVSPMISNLFSPWNLLQKQQQNKSFSFWRLFCQEFFKILIRTSLSYLYNHVRHHRQGSQIEFAKFQEKWIEVSTSATTTKVLTVWSLVNLFILKISNNNFDIDIEKLNLLYLSKIWLKMACGKSDHAAMQIA